MWGWLNPSEFLHLLLLLLAHPPSLLLACSFSEPIFLQTENEESQHKNPPMGKIRMMANRLALFYITKNGHCNNGYHICDKMWFRKSCLYWEWMPSHCHQCTTIFYQNLRGKLLLKTALRIHKEAKVQRCQGFVYFITFPLISTKCQTLKTLKEP